MFVVSIRLQQGVYTKINADPHAESDPAEEVMIRSARIRHVQPKHPARVEFYRLCSGCAVSMKLIYCQGIRVTTYPRHSLLKAAS